MARPPGPAQPGGQSPALEDLEGGRTNDGVPDFEDLTLEVHDGEILFSVEAFAEAALGFAALDVVVFALGVRLSQRDRILTLWK